MEAPLKRKRRDDQPSDCRSYRSNNQVCSQPRKMSISIVAVSKGKPAKGDLTSVLSNIQANNGKQGVKASRAKANRSKLNGQRGSLLTTPQSLVNRTRANAKCSQSIQSISISKEPITTKTLGSGDGKRAKVHNVGYGKGIQKDVTLKRYESVSLIAGQETSVQGEVTTGDRTRENNNSKQTLKMKLLEILGTNPSTDKQTITEYQAVELEANMLQKEEEVVHSTKKQFGDCCGGEEATIVHNEEAVPSTKKQIDGFRNCEEETDFVHREEDVPSTIEEETIIVHREEAVTSTKKQFNGSRSGEEETNIVHKEEAVPSTNKQFDDSHGDEEEGTAMDLEEAPKDNSPFRTKQNSDTIESDSEDPVQTTRTEKVSAKVRPKRLSKKLSYGNDENHVLSFEENNLAANCTVKTRKRLMSKGTGKKNGTGSHIFRTTMMVDPLKDQSNIPVSRTKSPSQVEDISLCAGMVSAHELPRQVQTDKAHGKDSHIAPDPRENDHLGNWNSPMTPKKDMKESFLCEPSPTNVNQISAFYNPELKTDATPEAPSPCAFDQVNEIEYQLFSSMLAARKISVRDIIKLERGFASGEINLGSSMKADLLDTPIKSGHTDTSTPSQSVRNNSALVERLNLGVKDFDSTHEELSVSKGTAEDADNSPEIFHLEEELILQNSKRLCTGEAVENSQVCPTMCSPNGKRSHEPSEKDQGDGLNRDIALFGCALERVKDKLAGSTMKKCSDIIASTVEEMQMKYQSAKAQIEQDLEKLTSLSRSRRHVLETKFNEQQEQLRLIHEKYISEINQHLKEFGSTVESLQAESAELRGAIEMQKASHLKLILQVEEAIQDRLSDTQRRVASVQDAGRSKMQQLKFAISECLNDGIFH